MTFCGKRYRFFPLILFSLFSAGFSFAEEELSSHASTASGIISAGIFLFCGLALYVTVLTVIFLYKTYKEAAQARKENASHGIHDERIAGQTTLLVVGWFFALCALIFAGSLLIGYFGASADLDISSLKSAGTLIITLGVTAFGGVALFLLSLLVSLIWKGFFGAHEGEARGAFDAGSIAGVPLNPEMTRRSFLSLLGWAWVAFTAATMGALSTCLRFAFPNVTFEPPLKFTAGFPKEYGIGVDERFKDGHRVWIVRNETGFYALSTICTHLGCTPNWLLAEDKFKCPCHGSGYYKTGVNFEGPAPRPLERFQISLGDDGQIVVDENIKFQQELGQWGLPGSFLEYKG